MASGPSIVAKFMADTSQMTSQVDKATSSSQTSIGSFAKKAALALGGAFAVDKIVEFGKSSVEAAAADAASQAQLAAALKNTSGATDAQVASAEGFISKLSKSAAIADDDLRPALATLARGFHDTGKAQDALSLATDVAAGTGKDLSTVTDAMAKAANGNTGALGRLGVATKDSSGKALSLDQIMANMAKTFKGQAAAAADSTAGRMKAAQIAFGEFQEQIGSALLPVIATLSTFLTGTLIPALAAIADWISGHLDVIEALGIGLAGVGAIILASLVPALIALAGSAAAAAAAMLLAAAPFIAIGAVIAALAFLIIHNWSTIVAATKAAWDAVTGAVRAAFNWIKANWPLLLAVITGPIGAAVLIVMRNWDTIRNGVAAVISWVRTNWPLLVAILTGPIGAATLAIIRNWDTIKQAATAMFTWVRDKFDAIAGAISGVVGTIAGAIGRVVSAIKSPINALISGWNNIEFRVPPISLPHVDLGPLGSFGGQSFGGWSFGFPNIPHLASGAVLTSPTLFLGGEAGREVVAPESLLRSIIREEGGGHYTLNLYPRTADAADIAYGFRRLELLAGLQ
jgi:hypothetical protein